MSGIKNDGPVKPGMGLIEELKQKQAAKNQQAAPVVAAPVAKKVPVGQAVQGAPLMKQPVKRAMPAVPKQKMLEAPVVPKEPRVLPKQPVKQEMPVHQPKAAPKPMAGADLKAQLARELIGVEYSKLPLEIQAIVTRNVKNPDNLIKEFDGFISSFVAKVLLDVMNEVKRFEGGVVPHKALEEFTDKASNLSFEEKAIKFVDTKSLNFQDVLGVEFFDGGRESVSFRKFTALFMKSMLPESFPLVRDMGDNQKMANGQLPFLYMLLIANMSNFSEMIEEADVNQIHMRYDVDDVFPGDYLTMVPPSIARLEKLQTLDIGYKGIAYYVTDIVLPDTILKLKNLRELNLHGINPVDGDDNEVVKALRARGCKVAFGDTYNQ